MAMLKDEVPAAQIQLPGFNLPYNYLNNDHFGSTLKPYRRTFTMPLTTLREFTMMRLMNDITDKPQWHKKIFDDEIATKWKKEALQTPEVDITQEMVDRCIDELRYRSKIFEKTGMVTAYNGDIVKSDVAVPDDLRHALIKAVQPLENVPPSVQDWHPGSDGKVLDLVHPSLFPLVYGLSRILPSDTTNLDDCIQRSGEGVTILLHKDDDYRPPGEKYGTPSWSWKQTSNAFSEVYQWLPCEVELCSGEPKITSYINNLHPQRHKKLYSIVEKVIKCAIPLWNESLTRQETPQYQFSRVVYCSAEPEYQESEPEQGSDEDEDDFYERHEAWEDNYLDSRAGQPDIEPFQPPDQALFEEDGITLKPDHRVDLIRDFGKIQVIVKLANIQLTPENPRYEGGTWHVEGQLNEHICASALYYYSNDNVTPSRLAFRHFVDSNSPQNIQYTQNYRRWLEDVFGCRDEGPALQDIGSVLTKEGRLITFPNTLLHQVQPFELSDSTKPGHRKLLALFLVDPHVKITSTENVPCQRKDWWRESIREQGTLLERFPLEVKDIIYDNVDGFPIPMEKAKELRLDLMEKRKAFVSKRDYYFNRQYRFSLCEH